jgi:hypothetical protein
MIQVMQEAAAHHQVKTVAAEWQVFRIALHIFQDADRLSLNGVMLTRKIYHVPGDICSY